MLDTSLDIALDFLKAHPNWYIFPITRLEKAPPCIDDNLKLASNDPKQIKMWHGRFRGCNWGLALAKSNVLCVDIDRKPGKVGQDTWDNLTLEYGDVPDTLTVRTPSGGLHCYFNGRHIFALGKNGFGIDVDSPNYVLIPGCWLCSNSEQGYELIGESSVADAPDWFYEFLKEKDEKDRTAAPDEAAVDLDKAANIERMIRYLKEGAPPSILGQGGEKTLFDVACVLKDNGISQYKAVQLLSEYYNVPGKCEPLWQINEGPEADRLDIKVRNAYDYARENQAGTATAEFAFNRPGELFDAAEQADLAKLTAYWNKKLPEMEKIRKGYDKVDDPSLEESVDDSDFLGEPVDDSDFLGDPVVVDDPPLDEPPKPSRSRKKDDAAPDAEPGAPKDKKGSKTKEDVLSEWVWVVGLERFVRVEDSKMWTRTQFDSRYNHFVQKGSSWSAEIFKESGMMKRFDDAISRPGDKMIIPPNFNLWRPSPIVPKEGNTDIWNEHLNYLFQNPEDKDHVLNWMAWVYQNQRRKPNHALLIVGKNTGTGKSFVARVFEQLIGVNNTQRPKNSSLKGDFNGWALRCKLVLIEELMQIGRREVANEMRDMITEPTIEVNIKNVPAQLVENYMAMLGVSNHPDALPIDETDRRWLVVSTPVARREPAYYDRIFTELLDNPEALAAVAYELKTRDLKGYDASQAAPDTTAKQEMIELSRSDIDQWLYDNAQNDPMTRRLVTIRDVIESMPPNYQSRGQRLNTTIQNFLRDKVRGQFIGQIRTNDGTKVRMWALNGKAGILRGRSAAELANIYDAERKPKSAGARNAQEQKVEDFGEPSD